MADIGKPVRRYKVIPVTDPERRAIPAPSVSPERAPSSPSVQPSTVPAEPEKV